MKFAFFVLGLAVFLSVADLKGTLADTGSDLQDLLAGREYEQYQEKDDHKIRLRILRHALERQLLILKSYSREGNASAVREKLLNMRILAGHIEQVATSIPRGSDSGELKNLEIKNRRLIETLNEIKLRHSVDLQSDFEETASTLENLRPFLFRGMFKLDAKGELDGPLAQAASMIHDSGEFFAPDEKYEELPEEEEADCRGIYFQRKRAVLERVIVSPTKDSFTPEEYSQLQNNDSLNHRLELFLRIAQNRIDSIESKARRCDPVKGVCLDSPLSNLLQGYQSAIHESMMRIDEAVRFRGKVDGRVGRSLNRLREAVTLLLPRLENFTRHIRGHSNSGPLLQKIANAHRLSMSARDWSQCEGQALIE